MILKLSILLAFCVALAFSAKAQNDGDTWVLLVAGSNHYYNYRHQSDVYNAYDLLVNKRNMDPSKVIVMQYDDIANSPSNPKKGTVINYPNGPDVYGPNEKNLKDYTGSDCTASNLLKVLSGQSTGAGSGRVINSGPNDRIFVAFFDHGAPGLVAMPTGGYLYAKDLLATVKSMNAQNKYKELVFYIEACESGSLFNGLLTDDMNVFAVTASNPTTSSWACDYDSTYRAYLNDCWSNFWMTNTDMSKTNGTYTMKDQNEWVEVKSTKSPQCLYGKKSIQAEFLSNFQGLGTQGLLNMQAPKAQPKWGTSSRTAFEQHFLKLAGSNSKVESLEARKVLSKYYKDAKKADEIYTAFAKEMGGLNLVHDPSPSCYPRAAPIDCIKDATEVHNKACGMYTEYSFKYSHLISNACEVHSAEKIGAAFNKICA